MEKITSTLQGIDDVARALIENCGEYKVWLFEGQMGAGKTTLIKAICSELQVEDVVSSPTFGIVNEYLSHSFGVVYHFDFYRLEEEDEALDIGVEDYFYGGETCFIEWSSKISSHIPERHVVVTIDIVDDQTRTIAVEYNG